MTSCQTEIDGYLALVGENERLIRGRDDNKDNRWSNTVFSLVARYFRNAGQRVPRTYVELAMAFQAIIANKNRLRVALKRLGEDRDHRRERDNLVARNATYEGQVKTLTTHVTKLRSIGSNVDTASGKAFDTMGTHIATLTRDNAELNGRLATSEATVNRFRKRSNGDIITITGLKNDFATRTVELERFQGKLTTTRTYLTTART